VMCNEAAACAAAPSDRAASCCPCELLMRHPVEGISPALLPLPLQLLLLLVQPQPCAGQLLRVWYTLSGNARHCSPPFIPSNTSRSRGVRFWRQLRAAAMLE
jgi:hypothetical protein